jgi:hypothetical protein
VLDRCDALADLTTLHALDVREHAVVAEVSLGQVIRRQGGRVICRQGDEVVEDPAVGMKR